MSHPVLCSVDVLAAPYARYTYALPPHFPGRLWQRGMRVLIPLGRRLVVGVLAALEAETPPGALRSVLLPLDREPLLDAAYLQMVEALAVRQIQTPGEVLARLLPAPLRQVPRLRLDGGAFAPQRLLDAEAALQVAEAFVDGALTVDVPAQAARVVVELASPPPWPIRPRAERQRAVLRHLDLHGPCTREHLRQVLGPECLAALPALIARGLVRLVEEDFSQPAQCPAQAPVALNGEQQQAVAELGALLRRPSAATALLFGVTGSGKTAVYLRLVEQVLAEGGQAMVLAPEVALALKLAGEVQAAFPHAPVLVYHGYLSPARRARLFAEARSLAGPAVVVGTRSALFLPVRPRLIVLDEEHDASFKQDEGLGYQAKEVAHARIAATAGLLLLGSATPDVKVYHAAQEGRIHLVRLSQRANAQPVPRVDLVDMRPHGDAVFAPQVRAAVDAALERDEQVVILHNRRGYAPILVCRGCAEPVRCPQCRISLTWHKSREILLCHYCGFHLEFPLLCPTCRGGDFDPLGEGTERLEEWLRRELPSEVAVARLDRDTGRRPERIQETLDAFSQGKTQVLVGTQMLCKGHHFPGVSLVVVVDGDLGLNLPDFRAVERSFQMLVQVAGRAGRGEVPGQVFVQTRNPEHPCWQFVAHADFEGMYRSELAMRRAMGYPPFVKLALVRLSIPAQGGDVAMVGRVGAALREAARRHQVTVLGPAPAPLAMLRGRRRFHCLLKGDDWPRLRAVCQAGMAQARRDKHIRMSVDFDPVDML